MISFRAIFDTNRHTLWLIEVQYAIKRKFLENTRDEKAMSLDKVIHGRRTDNVAKTHGLGSRDEKVFCHSSNFRDRQKYILD